MTEEDNPIKVFSMAKLRFVKASDIDPLEERCEFPFCDCVIKRFQPECPVEKRRTDG